jgi:co-chaperonin GroES (HSP10)
MTLHPQPGYVICVPYKLETKTGNFEIPNTENDPDKAPEFGEVIEVGALLPLKKMPYNAEYVPAVGDKIAYKKYNYFTLNIGVKQYVAVHFENILLRITDEQTKYN